MKFTKTQIERIKETQKQTKNQIVSATLLTEEFGFRVTRQDIQYWTKTTDNTPLSEDKNKITNASPEECIAELRALAQANPEIAISRNWYRNNSRYAESAWNGHFGTFEEFRRQAGIKLTRHARRMETDIARHASVDSFRQLNVEKRDWVEAFKKPSGKRFKTHLGGSDIHDIECDPFWRRCFLDTAKRVQPDVIDLNGDLFDLPEFGKYSVDPREWDVVGRIRWVHQFLEELRVAAPEAEINIVEGNHEFRLLRHLAEATPAMKAILADLHQMTVPQLLGLQKFEINYIAPADLAIFNKADAQAQLRRNFIIHYDFFAVCHFPEAERFGLPGWNGHHHKHHVKPYYSPVMGAYEWHQFGSGHKREASYCNGEKWGLGFGLVHIDTHKKRAQFEYIDVTHDHAVIGGKWYSRDEK